MKPRWSMLMAVGMLTGVAFLAGTAVSGPGEQEFKPVKPEAEPPPPQLRELDAFVGKWKASYEHLPAMFGAPGSGTGTSEIKWVLDGRFLMGKGTSTGTFGTYKHIWMMTYDPHMKAYRSFGFDNHGMADVPTVSYDPGSRTWTMVSDGIDFSTGQPAKNKTTMRLIGGDKMEWEWGITPQGSDEFKLLMRGSDTRVSAGG